MWDASNGEIETGTPSSRERKSLFMVIKGGSRLSTRRPYSIYQLVSRSVFEQAKRCINGIQCWVSPFLLLLPLFSLYIFVFLGMVTMVAKDIDLTPKIVASFLMEEWVYLLGEKYGFLMNIQLEVLLEDECITGGMKTRTAFHEASLDETQGFHASGHGRPAVIVSVVPSIIVHNAWRAIISFFSLMVHNDMEPRTCVFHAFF